MRIMNIGFVPLAAVMLAAVTTAVAQPSSPTSKYTSTAKKDSKVLLEGEDEGGSYFEYLCPGLGGYDVVLSCASCR